MTRKTPIDVMPREVSDIEAIGFSEEAMEDIESIPFAADTTDE